MRQEGHLVRLGVLAAGATSARSTGREGPTAASAEEGEEGCRRAKGYD